VSTHGIPLQENEALRKNSSPPPFPVPEPFSKVTQGTWRTPQVTIVIYKLLLSLQRRWPAVLEVANVCTAHIQSYPTATSSNQLTAVIFKFIGNKKIIAIVIDLKRNCSVVEKGKFLSLYCKGKNSCVCVCVCVCTEGKQTELGKEEPTLLQVHPHDPQADYSLHLFARSTPKMYTIFPKEPLEGKNKSISDKHSTAWRYDQPLLYHDHSLPKPTS
jgi:hypothetical protein